MLKMPPLRTQAKQHDAEVDSSANVSPRPPQAQFSLPQVANPAGEPWWCLVRPFHTSILVIRSFSQSCQSSQRFWWHPHVFPNTKREGPCWLTHTRIRIWSLLVRLLSSSPRRVGQSSHHPATPHPTIALRVRASASWTWSWNPRLSCSTRSLHPSSGIRGRDILLELV